MPSTSRYRLQAAVLGVGLAGFVLSAGGPARAEGPTVNGLRVGEHAGFSRIVLDLTAGRDFKYTFSEDFRELIVDISGLDWKAPTSRAFAKSQFVESYRVEGDRLIVRTARPIMVALVENLPPAKARGHRLYFDLARAPEFLVAERRFVPEKMAAAAPEPLPEPTPVRDEPVVVTAQSDPVGPQHEQAATAAEAEKTGREGAYFRVDAGYAIGGDAGISQAGMTGEMDDIGGSGMADIGLGYAFDNGLRADLTLGHVGWHQLDDRNAGTTYKADIGSTQLLVNGYVDFLPEGTVSPYVGAGIGAAYNAMGDVTASTGTVVKGKDGTVVAYQLMAGAGFKVGEATTLDLGYRYLNAGKLETEAQTTTGAAANKFDGDLIDHQVTLGARVGF